MQPRVVESQGRPIMREFCESLQKVLSQIKDEKEPHSILELESAMTRDELQSLITSTLGKESKDEVNAENLKPFCDFLAKRWERIQGKTGLTYFDLPQHPITQLCLTLARRLSPIVGKSVYELLIPNLGATHTVTGDDLNDIPLQHLVPSSPIGGKLLLIVVEECLGTAKGTREFKHTSRLDKKMESGELLDQSEMHSLQKQSTLTAEYYRQIIAVKKIMDELTIGHLVKKCVQGLLAGGEKKTGEYFSAGEIANRNMVALFEVINLLTEEERVDLYSRQTTHREPPITFKECIDKIQAPQDFKNQFDEVPCDEITAGDITLVLDDNPDLFEKRPKNANRILDLLHSLEMETKELKQRSGASLVNMGIAAHFEELEKLSQEFADKIRHDDYITYVRPEVDPVVKHAYTKKLYNAFMADDCAGLRKFATSPFVCTLLSSTLISDEQSHEQLQFLQALNKVFGKEQLCSIFNTERGLAQMFSYGLRGKANKTCFLEMLGIPYVLSKIKTINSLPWFVEAFPFPKKPSVDALNEVIGLARFNDLAREEKNINGVVTAILGELGAAAEKIKFIMTFCKDQLDKIIVDAKAYATLLAQFTDPDGQTAAKNKILMTVLLMRPPLSVDFAKLVKDDDDFARVVVCHPSRPALISQLADRGQLNDLIKDIQPDVFSRCYLLPLQGACQEGLVLERISSSQLQGIAGIKGEGLGKLLCGRREEAQTMILNKLGEAWLKEHFKHKQAEIQVFLETSRCGEKVQNFFLGLIGRSVMKSGAFASAQGVASVSSSLDPSDQGPTKSQSP